MERLEIVEYKYWLNPKTSARASIFGSLPYANEQEKEDWIIVNNGYSIRDNETGTQGQGKQPAKTMEEAKQRLEALKALYGRE